MRSLCLIRWLAAFSLIGLVASTHAGPHQIKGRVVGLTDGDTITLLDTVDRQHKIRLDGIDAPEGGQPFGAASKRHLSDLAFDRQAVAECSKTHRYDRQVCKLLIDGTDAGLAQVRAGMAWYFRR